MNLSRDSVIFLPWKDMNSNKFKLTIGSNLAVEKIACLLSCVKNYKYTVWYFFHLLYKTRFMYPF